MDLNNSMPSTLNLEKTKIEKKFDLICIPIHPSKSSQLV